MAFMVITVQQLDRVVSTRSSISVDDRSSHGVVAVSPFLLDMIRRLPKCHLSHRSSLVSPLFYLGTASNKPTHNVLLRAPIPSLSLKYVALTRGHQLCLWFTSCVLRHFWLRSVETDNMVLRLTRCVFTLLVVLLFLFSAVFVPPPNNNNVETVR